MSKLKALALACVVAISAVLSTGAAAFAAQPPPPECAYDDVLTQHHARSEWQISLLDSYFRLPRAYEPSDLVPVANANIGGRGKIRAFVIADLKAMATAARDAGAPLRVVSAYRSYSQQRALFRQEVANFGRDYALQSVARPGHSEHQLGTTIDFGSANSSKGGWQYSDWSQTPAGSWIMANGWKYGFLLSYPDGKTDLTCYHYEPWHYRYVGREIAADIRGTGLTLREYIWKHYE